MNLKAIAKDILIFSRVGEISPDLVTLVSLITFYLSLFHSLSTSLYVSSSLLISFLLTDSDTVLHAFSLSLSLSLSLIGKYIFSYYLCCSLPPTFWSLSNTNFYSLLSHEKTSSLGSEHNSTTFLSHTYHSLNLLPASFYFRLFNLVWTVDSK